jgi:hypothetical protein
VLSQVIPLFCQEIFEKNKGLCYAANGEGGGCALALWFSHLLPQGQNPIAGTGAVPQHVIQLTVRKTDIVAHPNTPKKGF